MLEGFGQDAFRSVTLAIGEADNLKHNWVGPEHLLLGLLHLEHGDAARDLADEGIKLEVARAEVIRIIPQGIGPIESDRTWTAQARRILDGARRVALIDGHDQVDPTDLLQALLTETSGGHVDVLRRLRRS